MRKLGLGWSVALALLFASLMQLGLALLYWLGRWKFLVLSLIQFAGNFAIAVYSVGSSTIRQAFSADQLLGRAFNSFGSSIAMIVGSIVAGLMVGTFGHRGLLIAAGIGVSSVGIIQSSLGGLRDVNVEAICP